VLQGISHGSPYVSDEMLVQFKPGVSVDQQERFLAPFGAGTVHRNAWSPPSAIVSSGSHSPMSHM